MKRQELLRQLDREVEGLKDGLAGVSKHLDDVYRRLAEFKDEERKPKWAKSDTHGQHSTIPGKWYRILGHDSDGYYIVDEEGDRRYPVGWGWWDICYDDEPPVEKKTPKWAKRKTNNSPYDEGRVPAGRWLKYIDKNTVIDIHGQKWHTSEPDLWELSYSESKPVEKCSKCGQEIH